MDPDFNITLTLDSDKKKEEKKESDILSSIQEITNNSTSATFMVAIVSHMILNSMKK